MPVNISDKDFQLYSSGSKLYGDDFTHPQILKWYKDEEHASYDIYSGVDTTQYDALNWYYAYRHFDKNFYDKCVALGIADGKDIEPFAKNIGEIFGIVPDGRFTFYHDDKVLNLSPGYYTQNPLFDKIFPLPLLDTDHVNYYQPLTALHQVISICNKVGAQLLIAGLSSTLIDHCIQFPNYISLCHYCFGMDSYINRKNDFLDVGTDHIHPGPLTHQFYAKNIIAKIQQLRFNLC